jgi:hypothetical protein
MQADELRAGIFESRSADAHRDSPDWQRSPRGTPEWTLVQ